MVTNGLMAGIIGEDEELPPELRIIKEVEESREKREE